MGDPVSGCSRSSERACSACSPDRDAFLTCCDFTFNLHRWQVVTRCCVPGGSFRASYSTVQCVHLYIRLLGCVLAAAAAAADGPERRSDCAKRSAGEAAGASSSMVSWVCMETFCSVWLNLFWMSLSGYDCFMSEPQTDAVLPECVWLVEYLLNIFNIFWFKERFTLKHMRFHMR